MKAMNKLMAAAVGGLLFGPVGAAGAVAAATVADKVSESNQQAEVQTTKRVVSEQYVKAKLNGRKLNYK